MSSPDALEARAPELLVLLVRTLRVVAVHDLDNDAALQVAGELRQRLAEDLRLFDTVALAVSDESVYFNGEFVKVRGAAFDAALQARQLYEKLGINEIRFVAPPDEAELKLFLAGAQASLHSPEPTTFAQLVFPKVVLKPVEEAHKLSIDERVALARTYAQLVAILQESVLLLDRDKPLALARLRRAVHELVRASERHVGVLVGLTRYDGLRGDPALHAAAVGALVLAMGLELALSRKAIVTLAQAALLHHLADRTLDAAPHEAEAHDTEAIVRLARAMPTVEVVDRLALVLEAAEVEAIEKHGIIPSAASKCIAVACAFDRLTRTTRRGPGLMPDQALRLLLAHGGGRYDLRALRLLVTVVGLYPVGSMVRLSSGELGVVLTAPASGADLARPTVRVVEAEGRPASYVLALTERRDLAVVECVDPRSRDLNVVHYLLA